VLVEALVTHWGRSPGHAGVATARTAVVVVSMQEVRGRCCRRPVENTCEVEYPANGVRARQRVP